MTNATTFQRYDRANRSFFGAKKTILLCHTWEQDGVVNMIIIIIIIIEKRYSTLSTCNVFISALKNSQWTHVYSDSHCSR